MSREPISLKTSTPLEAWETQATKSQLVLVLQLIG